MNALLPGGVRDRIVATAARIFFLSGFSRVLMDDLARELGMSKKTLYSHFASKEELLRAVLVQRTREVEQGLEAIVSTRESFPLKLGHLARFLQGKVAQVSPVFLEDIRRYAPECFQVVEEFRARAIPRYFGRLFEEGIRERARSPASKPRLADSGVGAFDSRDHSPAGGRRAALCIRARPSSTSWRSSSTES